MQWPLRAYGKRPAIRKDGRPPEGTRRVTPSTGSPAPVPLSVKVASYDTCDGSRNLISGRDYLSDLVLLQNVKVVQRFPTLPTTGFHVVGPWYTFEDTIYVENQNNVLGPYSSSNPNYPPLGSLVDVIGCVHYTTGTSTPSFRVCPRTAGDITIKDPSGVGGLSTARLSFSVFPNPGRDVKVSFTLPTRKDVQLGIYDLAGRRVAVLARGMMEAGTYLRNWSGLDDSGNRVRPGMYFYRLRADNDVRTAHAILLRE